jgi:hypothetical protein
MGLIEYLDVFVEEGDLRPTVDLMDEILVSTKTQKGVSIPRMKRTAVTSTGFSRSVLEEKKNRPRILIW